MQTPDDVLFVVEHPVTSLTFRLQSSSVRIRNISTCVSKSLILNLKRSFQVKVSLFPSDSDDNLLELFTLFLFYYYIPQLRVGE